MASLTKKKTLGASRSSEALRRCRFTRFALIAVSPYSRCTEISHDTVLRFTELSLLSTHEKAAPLGGTNGTVDSHSPKEAALLPLSKVFNTSRRRNSKLILRHISILVKSLFSAGALGLTPGRSKTVGRIGTPALFEIYF